MLKNVINIPLLQHPVNWLFVWIVLALAAFAWALVHDAIAASPTSPTSTSTLPID